MRFVQKMRADDILSDWHAGLAALSWQLDMGVTEVIGDAPINRYDLAEATKPVTPEGKTREDVHDRNPTIAQNTQTTATPINATEMARLQAQKAQTLAELCALQAGFDLCDLKKGARNHVFADGNPQAHVMILGEAPDIEEDREGRPFVGAAGQLLDKMLAAIGLSRTDTDPRKAVYLANVMPWRPAGNRALEPHELAMMMPFVERHVALVNPDIVIVMGNTALASLGGGQSLQDLRGRWISAFGKPAIPMLHPNALLRTPLLKREAWKDLLAVSAKLYGG
jgi:uracil-DNA glycosylase family 4